MAKPKINMNTWPIVQVVWQTNITVAELEEHFAELLERVRTHPEGNIVAVVDISHLQVSALARSRAAKGIDEVTAEVGERLLGIAYVSNSGLSRGLATAIHWLVRRDLHIRTFDTRAAALVWARSLLEEQQSTGG